MSLLLKTARRAFASAAILGLGLSLLPAGASGDECSAVKGVGLVKQQLLPQTPAYYLGCGFPAASAEAGLIALGGPDQHSCMGKVCLFSAKTGKPIREWVIDPWGPAPAESPGDTPIDVSELEALLRDRKFVPMIRVEPLRRQDGSIDHEVFDLDGLRITFHGTQHHAHLEIHAAARLVKTHQFPPRTLRCHDDDVGRVRRLRRVPRSVEVWGLEGMPAIVVLATYYGLELGCSYFDGVVVAHGLNHVAR